MHAYLWVPLPIFGENSAHLMRGECINLIAGTEMTGPVALNDREQTGISISIAWSIMGSVR
jgi:hypothetical protein